MNSKVIIGIIIAIAVIGIIGYSMSSSPSDIVIEEENAEITPEGKQFVLELSDAVSMEGT